MVKLFAREYSNRSGVQWDENKVYQDWKLTQVLKVRLCLPCLSAQGDTMLAILLLATSARAVLGDSEGASNLKPVLPYAALI